ncbi:MAG TPA: dTDP-4-dehydrorhamnose reductase [Methylovirgula sp.]|nr:dTDP-4-dehydrorhamnose reductase [Methylovirgula sp.]
MRLAVIGSQGQVARSLVERAPADAEIVTLGRPHFDLAAPASMIHAVERIRPDMIVNAAGYTAVDKAESEEDLAYRINAFGAGKLAEAADRLAVPLIYFSTDYVFDGTLDRAYREEDLAAPINAYGRTKLAGEDAVRAAGPAHVILRTSWVYSPYGTNFVRTMLRLGETRDEVDVVADQVGQPTSALDIADAVFAICRRLAVRRREEICFGTFHMAGTGATSWADFAEAIFAEAARHGRRRVAVAHIKAANYPTPARRPANSRLDTGKLAETFDIVLPDWRRSLAPIVARLLG